MSSTMSSKSRWTKPCVVTWRTALREASPSSSSTKMFWSRPSCSSRPCGTGLVDAVAPLVPNLDEGASVHSRSRDRRPSRTRWHRGSRRATVGLVPSYGSGAPRRWRPGWGRRVREFAATDDAFRTDRFLADAVGHALLVFERFGAHVIVGLGLVRVTFSGHVRYLPVCSRATRRHAPRGFGIDNPSPGLRRGADRRARRPAPRRPTTSAGPVKPISRTLRNEVRPYWHQVMDLKEQRVAPLTASPTGVLCRRLIAVRLQPVQDAGT